MIVMTTGDMLGYGKRLINIVRSDSAEDIKNERLANLMTDLERAYQIPSLLANATNVDPIALQFYQMVSNERSF